MLVKAHLLSIIFVGLAVAQQGSHNSRPVARQPVPRSQNPLSNPGAPAEGCPQSRITQCLGHLMALNITALHETFKVYELLSFANIADAKLREQARITTDTCRVFNQFNNCTGGDFLKCFDKKKFIDIIQGFASASQSRPGSGSSMNSMMNEIAALITDQQIDYVGRAMIDACRKIQNGEVKLAELAMCIRKDKRLLDQLATLAPESSNSDAAPASAAQEPLSIGKHCKVFRCDGSRILIHMLVRAAQNCSDDNGSKFIFWVGQVGLTGVKTATPSDVTIANGEFGTQTQSEGGDQCTIRDSDLEVMKRTVPKTFSDIGITRANELCAAEVATTTKLPTTVIFRYNPDRPSNKIALEATLDDVHNDEYWENGAPSLSTGLLPIVLSFLLMFFLA